MIADFAAGCFWGVQEEFERIDGVTYTTVGYEGGDVENPSYEEVCTGTTGHAETCRIEYDENKVCYEMLLDTFFKIHDPTQINRQGADIGSQYRSIIFYHDEDQKKKAIEGVKKVEEQLGKEVATQILPAKEFYRAEEYHQHYLKKN